MTTADEAAFDAFVAARFAALARTAYLLTGNHHDAEDLVQVALTKAARAGSRIEVSPEAYVRRILYRENISRHRRRRVAEYPTATVPESVAEDADKDTQLTLRAALGRLTAKQRTVLVLRFYEDLTEQQTAAAMGVTAGTVKSQTRHALMRLRQLAPELVELVQPVGEPR